MWELDHKEGCACLLNCFSHVQLFVVLWTLAIQGPPSMGMPEARILEWVSMPSSRGSSPHRDQTQVSCSLQYCKQILYCWATREAQRGWAPKKWCFWTVVVGKTLESSWTARRSRIPVISKGNQPWIFIGRTDAEAPIPWQPDVNSQLIGKDSDPGKD